MYLCLLTKAEMEYKLLPVNITELSTYETLSNVHFYNGERFQASLYDIAILNYDPNLGLSLRNELYSLHLGAHAPLEIIDLGDCFAMPVEEITRLISDLIQDNCYPILIGFPESIVASISEMWDKEFLPHHICWISSSYNNKLVDQLCDHIFLKDQYLLGIQRQMSDVELLEPRTQNIHLSYLSEFRKSPQSIECYTRNSELFYINLQSVRHSDFPASTNPSGFFSEEIISLAKSSGSSDRSLCTIVSDWNLDSFTNEKTSAILIAQMIWYTMEGYILKLKDKRTNRRNLLHYVVEIKNTDIHLDFFKSEISGKWWVQEPMVDSDIQGKLIPCTYEEYVKTVHENVPDRLMSLLIH